MSITLRYDVLHFLLSLKLVMEDLKMLTQQNVQNIFPSHFSFSHIKS
jgi:hypothetical protein